VTRELSGIYDLPAPMWVTFDVLGTRVQAGMRGLDFEIRLPEYAVIGGLDVFSPPELPGISSDDAELIKKPWAMHYAAETTEPAVALCRIGLVCEISEQHAGLSRFGDDGSLAYRTGQALAERIQDWFDEAGSWAEVATGQDLNYRHPVFASEDPAKGLLMNVDGELKGAGQIRLSYPHIQPVTFSVWKHIAAHVLAGRRPPTEHRLIQDAYASLARDAHRRAVLDAATALEIVLTNLLIKTVESMDERPRQAFLKEQRMLSKLIDFLRVADVKMTEPWQALRTVATLRNAAIHKGSDPDPLEAALAVSTVSRVVAQHGTLA
jgi:hypothetical protein